MTGITPDAMRRFLVCIAPGVNGVPVEMGLDEEIDLRAIAAVRACEHLPAEVLDDRAIGDALRTFDTWPSAAAIFRFLSVRHRGGASLPTRGVVPPGTLPAPSPAPLPEGAGREGPQQSLPAPTRRDGQGKS
jgi:hypothetical protein